MMIAISPYELFYKNGKESRKGVLVRLEKSGVCGFADCHPWHELSDEPLEKQIEALKSGSLTPILTQTLTFAGLDLEARSRKISLFEGHIIPKSHLLTWIEELPQALAQYADWGITLIKVKVKGDEADKIVQLTPHLEKHQMKWRLDFNAQMSPEEAERYLEKLAPISKFINLIEDICPYNKSLWETFQTKYGVTLACDFEKPIGRHSHPIVYKPCSSPPSDAIFSKRLIVTSSLGHPVGQLMAVYAAITMPNAQNEVGGFLSHHVFKPNPFSERFQIKEARLVIPGGHGFGFDDLLEALPWQTL